jgi:hypothetical protein
MGDCRHSDEVRLGTSSEKIESVNVDSAGLAEDKALKKFITGPCQ